MGSIDFGKAVFGDEKELSKAVKKFTIRCLSGVSVFFVVLFVQLLLKSVGASNNGMLECIACFTSDGSKCSTYEVEKIDYSAEKAEADKQKAEFEDKKEEEIKKKEEESKKEQTISPIPPGGSKEISNALGLPYYNQCDPRWEKIQYDIGGGKNGTPATLCSSACGYTSLSMVVAGLTKNSDITPYTMVKLLRGIKDGQLTRRGYGAASIDELTSSKLSQYGIKGTSISSSKIMSSLKAGKPVVMLIEGHYMALSISSSGKIVLLDPYTRWSNKRKGPGEFNSVDEILSTYNKKFKWAAAYEKI